MSDGLGIGMRDKWGQPETQQLVRGVEGRRCICTGRQVGAAEGGVPALFSALHAAYHLTLLHATPAPAPGPTLVPPLPPPPPPPPPDLVLFTRLDAVVHVARVTGAEGSKQDQQLPVPVRGNR